MAANINIPFVAAMQADGTATLQTQYQEQWNFSGTPDAIFAGALPQDVIDAFLLSQEADSGVIIHNVTMQNSSAFQAALASALIASTVSTADDDLSGKYATAGAVSKTLQEYIVAWARQQIDADLTSNSISANIEANEVENLAIDISAGAADGAENMYDGLVGLSQELRNVVASQLPSGRYNDAGESFVTVLPLVSGDKMTFRFNVNSSITITENPQDLTGGANATTVSSPGIGSGYGVSTRLVEVVLTKA